MPDDPFQIRVEPRTQQLPARAIRRNKRWIALAAATGLLLVVGAAISLRFRPTPRNTVAMPAEAGEKSPIATAAAEAPSSPDQPQEQIVPDDGRLLWASPTAGPPIELAFIPPSTQVLIHLRPALIAKRAEGMKSLAALGPWGEQAMAELANRFGCLPDELLKFDSLLIGVSPDADDRLLVTLRATLADEQETQQQAKGSDAFIASFPTSDGAARHAIVVWPPEIAKQMRQKGLPPPLAPDLERLVLTSDADRLATVIFAPRFLQASGGPLLSGVGETLRDALRWLTGDRAAAAAFSLHWDDDFFIELRAGSLRSAPPQPYSSQLKKQLLAAPAVVEDFVSAEPWPPYGRKVVARLPAMLRTLARYARSGVDQDQAVVRCYLPAPAGHNLLLATELVLTQPRGQWERADNDAKKSSTSSEPQSIEDALQRPTSLSFAKDTLQQALELLSIDLGVPIEILGADLQLDGITKNQSFAIDERNRPAGEILVEVLRRANPDRTATGPDDPKQKLVYTVRAATETAPERIVVTTRAAAAKRGERLPGVFRAP